MDLSSTSSEMDESHSSSLLATFLRLALTPRSGYYRPDIDGLRAVAVIAVIAFHMNLPRLQGGFVGVDIFFVISGYLITSIIWREIQLGRFSVAGFYERRARRILPALATMMIVCAGCGWFILLPGEFALLVFK